MHTFIQTLLNPYHRPDILDPECVKMHKMILGLRSSHTSKEIQQKILNRRPFDKCDDRK